MTLRQNSRLFYLTKEVDKEADISKSVAFEVRFDIFSLLISDKWRPRSQKSCAKKVKGVEILNFQHLCEKITAHFSDFCGILLLEILANSY